MGFAPSDATPYQQLLVGSVSRCRRRRPARRRARTRTSSAGPAPIVFLDEERVASPDNKGVNTVGVPVATGHSISNSTVDDGLVCNTSVVRFDEEGVAAPNGKGVDTVAIPVADEPRRRASVA